MTKLISLTRGLFTLVDDRDFEHLSSVRWHARVAPVGAVYVSRSTTDRAYVYMHREIMGLTPKDRVHVDHVNDDTLDNRRCNLRVASHSDNVANGVWHKPTRSGYRGVWPGTKGGWEAHITVRHQRIYLGHFHTAIEAAAAYDSAAQQHRGEFARLNFPRKEGHWSQSCPEVAA